MEGWELALRVIRKTVSCIDLISEELRGLGTDLSLPSLLDVFTRYAGPSLASEHLGFRRKWSSFSSDTNGGAVIPPARGPVVFNSGRKQRLYPFLDPNERSITRRVQRIADLVRPSRPQTVK